jgi:hypothetical protein
LRPTLIITPHHSEDSIAIWKAAQDAGWNITRLREWRLTAEARAAAEPVIYVEVLIAARLARELGLDLVKPPEDFLPRLPERFRKRAIRLTTAGDARRLDRAFIKPPTGKSFPARVYEEGELPQQLEDRQPVLVSEVVDWSCEFRVFALDGRVQTISAYEYEGELLEQKKYACPEEDLQAAKEFAQSVLDEAEVPNPTVLDVGVIEERGWAVVEANAPWSSGLYGCDPTAALEVIRRSMGVTT